MCQRYEAVVTHSCNWECPYCAVDTHNNFISNTDALSKLRGLPKGTEVTLSGGELGMEDESFILEAISILEGKDCLINLNTNGLFLEKYPKLVKHFSSINYHCSEDLTDKKITYYKQWEGKIKYLLVVHDANLPHLEDFFKHNNSLKFEVVPASNPETGIFSAPELSAGNMREIVRKYSSSLTPNSLLVLLGIRDLYAGVTFL